MIQAFFVIFISVFLAQMGDKTQLLTLLFAAKTKKRLSLFLSVMLGFLIGVTLAVFVGAEVNHFIPHTVLKFISALIFMILGLFLILKKKKISTNLKQFHIGNEFITTSLIIFLADFGDKTQIALALFASSNNPFLVLFAGMLALSLISILTIYFSKIITTKIKPSIIEKIAGVIFIFMGLFLFISKS